MTAQDFIQAYNSRNMYAYAMDEERCHIGKAPTITQAFQMFGKDAVCQVLDELIGSFVSFTSASRGLSTDQRQRLVWVIITQYGWLKITEIILFIVKAEAGNFGKFYNTLDPMDITTALNKWRDECNKARNAALLAAFERERERERQEAENNAEAGRIAIKAILHNGKFKYQIKHLES